MIKLAKPDGHYYRTAHVGQTVKFPCETNLNEPVNWKRTDSFEYIYRRGRLESGSAPRITVDRNHSYTLTIRNITGEDATSYGCFEDAGYGNRRFYHLTVAGFNLLTSFRFETVYTGHYRAGQKGKASLYTTSSNIGRLRWVTYLAHVRVSSAF